MVRRRPMAVAERLLAVHAQSGRGIRATAALTGGPETSEVVGGMGRPLRAQPVPPRQVRGGTGEAPLSSRRRLRSIRGPTCAGALAPCTTPRARSHHGRAISPHAVGRRGVLREPTLARGTLVGLRFL